MYPSYKLGGSVGLTLASSHSSVCSVDCEAVHWPLLARPNLSAASFYCVPDARSPLLPHPSVSLPSSVSESAGENREERCVIFQAADLLLLHQPRLLVSTFKYYTDLVSLTLQVDVLLICLHLQLLHFALQSAIGLVKTVFVSGEEKIHEITSLLQHPVTQHLQVVFLTFQNTG